MSHCAFSRITSTVALPGPHRQAVAQILQVEQAMHAHTVSTVMGHSSVAFTLDVYTDAWDEAAAQAAAALDNALSL
jgi:hypothetical protein